MTTRSHWVEESGHPIEDWKYEAANDDTRLGYLDWVDARKEQEPEETRTTTTTPHTVPDTRTFEAKLQTFAVVLKQEVFDWLEKQYPPIHEANKAQLKDIHDHDSEVGVTKGRKYTKVDVGRSGRYMVENSTGKIFGIKGYGVIHRGHQYGTLETITDWYWGPYRAVMRGEL